MCWQYEDLTEKRFCITIMCKNRMSPEQALTHSEEEVCRAHDHNSISASSKAKPAHQQYSAGNVKQDSTHCNKHTNLKQPLILLQQLTYCTILQGHGCVWWIQIHGVDACC